MSGELDPLYVAARRTLLDAIDALQPHRASLVLVGAQAIYIHAGEAEFAVAPYTTDGDLALNPRSLAANPRLAEAMTRAGFVASAQPGTWMGGASVAIDLLVPEALGGDTGRRGARLGEHGNRAARRAKGLEATLVDRETMTLSSLDPSDSRKVEIAVAGPAALIVTKLHKIAERTATPERLKNKDALDVLRLLRAIGAAELAERIANLRGDPLSRVVTEEAILHLRNLFGQTDSLGARMAADATVGLEDPLTIRGSCAVLSQDLLTLLP